MASPDIIMEPMTDLSASSEWGGILLTALLSVSIIPVLFLTAGRNTHNFNACISMTEVKKRSVSDFLLDLQLKFSQNLRVQLYGNGVVPQSLYGILKDYLLFVYLHSGLFPYCLGYLL